jgi:hypothetical protein
MAGTDKTQNQVLGPAPLVVLAHPQLGENIGTAARAMANFGLHELRLVAPRDGWPNEKALTASSGAHWIVEGAKVFDDLPAALADMIYVYATTARPRDMIKEVITPEQAGDDMRVAWRGRKIALLLARVLGPQQRGSFTCGHYRRHRTLHLPPSLSRAVLLWATNGSRIAEFRPTRRNCGFWRPWPDTGYAARYQGRA